MKRNFTVRSGLIAVFVLSLLVFGCAEQKTMQPMDTEMENMEKEPLHSGTGSMEKMDMKKDMTESMGTQKTMFAWK
jgi:hypothetical protein